MRFRPLIAMLFLVIASLAACGESVTGPRPTNDTVVLSSWAYDTTSVQMSLYPITFQVKVRGSGSIVPNVVLQSTGSSVTLEGDVRNPRIARERDTDGQWVWKVDVVVRVVDVGASKITVVLNEGRINEQRASFVIVGSPPYDPYGKG